MVDDLSDVWKELKALKAEVRAQRTATPFENASVTNGSVRFIGGTLRVEEDGRVEIVGTLSVEGQASVSGPLTISGELNVTGPARISGELDVTGPATISETLHVGGDTTIDGTLDIGAETTLDSSLTVVEGGSVTVDGDLPATLESVSNGGVSLASLSFPGARIVGYRTSLGEGLAIGPSSGSFIKDPSIFVMDDKIGISATPLPSGTDAKYLVVTNEGYIYTSAGVGGGGTPEPGQDLGNFQWPFSLDTVTSEYGPRWGRIHEGIDFGNPPAVAGAPIIAAGDGTIAVNTFSAGWGNYVRITHTLTGGQQVSTLYAHMNAPGLPPVGSTVEKGDVIGYVGNTGNSFGAHLHFETWMSTSYGSHVNPRDFMAAYGPE